MVLSYLGKVRVVMGLVRVFVVSVRSVVIVAATPDSLNTSTLSFPRRGRWVFDILD